jgi:hypothetical protein
MRDDVCAIDSIHAGRFRADADSMPLRSGSTAARASSAQAKAARAGQ